jgi:hypothetical protein
MEEQMEQNEKKVEQEEVVFNHIIHFFPCDAVLLYVLGILVGISVGRMLYARN